MTLTGAPLGPIPAFGRGLVVEIEDELEWGLVEATEVAGAGAVSLVLIVSSETGVASALAKAISLHTCNARQKLDLEFFENRLNTTFLEIKYQFTLTSR